MTKYSFLLLGFIFLIGFTLRFVNLSSIPSGFYKDEAFLGYNAFSLLKTGKDMNGNSLPLHLRSFIYTPAGYSYLTIPFISVFDLNNFSVRLPSVVFGSLTIIVMYFLTLEIVKTGNHDFFKKNSSIISVFSSFIIAVSPWHVLLSRTASIITVVVFLICLGTLVFFYWIKNQKKVFMFVFYLLFSLSLLFYIVPYSFLPLFIPFIFLLFVKKTFSIHKNKLFYLLYFVLIMVPLLITLVSPKLSLRAKSISIFTSPEANIAISNRHGEDGVSSISPIISRIFHNKALVYTDIFLRNYFSHLSYSFFFTDNSFPERYKISDGSLLYLFELPLIIVGLYVLIKKELKIFVLLTGWILLSPLGSGLTFDDIPNMLRILSMYPPLAIINSIGAITVFYFLQNKKHLGILLFLTVIFSGFSIVKYFHLYFVHGKFYRPWHRQEGYQKLVEEVNKNLPNFKNAIITNRESAPTIFFLFYNKYDPYMFQKEIALVSDQDVDRVNFNKYEFSEKECPLKYSASSDKNLIPPKKGILYVNSGLCEIQEKTKILKTIKRTDGSTAFYILTPN